MKGQKLTDAKRRILDVLKRAGPTRASDLATALALTDVAVRQHLQTLEEHGLVTPERLPPRGRGRPATSWALTRGAHDLFPERHAELTIDLIEATRRAVGEQGLERVIAARAEMQIASYRRRLPSASASLKKRVEALAAIRSAEGYMAEIETEKPGSYLLIENHCPICAAAEICTGLCRSELEVFQTVLGPRAHVERVEYQLAGERRCVYRVRKS